MNSVTVSKNLHKAGQLYAKVLLYWVLAGLLPLIFMGSAHILLVFQKQFESLCLFFNVFDSTAYAQRQNSHCACLKQLHKSK